MFLLNDEEVEYYYKCKASNEELELVTFMEVRNIIHKLIQVISDGFITFHRRWKYRHRKIPNISLN